MAADFGLQKIARLMDKEDALAEFMEAAAAEEAGDFNMSITHYKRAFRMWDALDSSLDEGGLPVAVRREAEAAGVDCSDISNDVPMETQTSQRFSLEDSDEWLAHLQDNGYCVLSGVADAEAVMQAKSLLWDFMEGHPDSNTRRRDPSTWDDAWLPNASNGILGVHGFGQSAFCWHARLLRKVRQAFATVWGCKDVIASFDGGNVFRPWRSRPDWRTAGGWWHVDQNASLPDSDGLRCVQGLVTFADATPATGGLCVIPGSHRQHNDMCSRAKSHILSGHFVGVQPGDPVLGRGARLVCAKAGDLILWDSRCVHCNTPGLLEAEGDGPSCDSSAVELLRVAAYVCMTPAAWASPDVLAQRKQGFLRNETTDHVPHEWHGTGQELPWPLPQIWEDASFVKKRLIVGAKIALIDQANRGEDQSIPNTSTSATAEKEGEA